MTALTILYHDIVRDDFDESGFPGDAAARYKFRVDEFEEHIAEIAAQAPHAPVTVKSITADEIGCSPAFLFSVDDGGASASLIADCIEKHGWRGHFFITTDLIDTAAFVTSAQIRDLHRRGHIIGSHSCSHPIRFSELPAEDLSREWNDSVAKLADILGEEVTSASVPGGFYSPRVAEFASAAGIQTLFTSEPTTAVETVAGCRIFGRYNVYRGMSAKDAGAIAAGKPLSLLRQKLTWEAKKNIKRFAWPLWAKVRSLVFKK